MTRVEKCFNGHTLVPFHTPFAGFICDNHKCRRRVPRGDTMMGCKPCRIHLCDICTGQAEMDDEDSDSDDEIWDMFKDLRRSTIDRISLDEEDDDDDEEEEAFKAVSGEESVLTAVSEVARSSM